MLLYAIVFITLALVFYTIAVWWEKIKGTLLVSHVIVFWLGLICDCIGTFSMSQVAGATAQTGLTFHGITGAVAILLMFIHTIWASFVVYKNDERAKLSFHKFSIFVWLIWLVPYFSGMIMGMRG